jgi:hypothetical protein
MTYEERIEEEKLKFCENNNLEYEVVDAFVSWLLWFSKQKVKKDLKALLNK